MWEALMQEGFHRDVVPAQVSEHATGEHHTTAQQYYILFIARNSHQLTGTAGTFGSVVASSTPRKQQSQKSTPANQQSQINNKIN
jgi:hypothetical protein